MRRMYLGAAAVLSIALIAGFGPRIFSSGGKEKEAPTTAAPASKMAKSRIDKVVVYPGNALVTREVEVPDGTGLVELVVTPMPDQIVPSTMYSEGGNGLRVLTTRFTTRHVLEDTSEDRRKLEAELEKFQVIGSKIDSEIANLQKNMELLGKLENVTQKTDRTGDEVIAIAKYVMEQRVEKAKQIVTIQEQKRQNTIQLQFISRKMSELGRGSGRMERDAVIVVDREGGKGGKVRLNYLVGAVTWNPEYKLRAGKVNEDVQLDYLANLRQHSGEDWNQVKMTLSTAQPMLNASPPELCMLQPVLVVRGTQGAPPMPGGGGFAASPFFNPVAPAEIANKAAQGRAQAAQLNSLNFSQQPLPGNFPGGGMPGMQPPGKGGPSGGGGFGGGFGGMGFSQPAIQKEADRILNEASAWEQNLDLMRSREEVLAQGKKRIQPAADPSRTDGPSVTYHLVNRLSVPSRNDEQVIEITKLKLAPKYYYKAVPVLNRHVYRLADLVNNSNLELLPGEATMYQGTDFVGRMPMPLVAIGEEFTAGFGVDTQLQIQRQMVDQNRSTQGGNQVLKYEYRILISSFKNEPVKLQLWDRLPKGETESINVNMIKCSPELSKDGLYVRESRPNNLLRWDVDVPANCNGEKAVPVSYEFRMELDRQMAITGFQSR